MKPSKIKASLLEIPLKISFQQANSESNFSRSVLVEIETENGLIGKGECCPRTYVTGETIASVLADVQGLKEEIKGTSFQSLAAIQSYVLGELPGRCGLSSICAIEGALLQAFAAEKRQSFFEIFDLPESGALKYSGVLPLCALPKFPKVLERVSPLAFDEVKIKIGNDVHDSLSRVKGVQQTFGPDVRIRIDANCGWSFSEALQQIPILAEAGVIQFEQIFPKGKELQLSRITEKFGADLRITVDESFTSYESAVQLLEMGACNHFNFKLSKNGGIFHALKIKTLLDEHGYSAQLGAHFGETSLLTASGMVFANLAGNLTSLEGAFGTHLLEWDVQEPALQFGVGGILKF